LVLPLCSILSNGGHVGWSAGTSDIILQLDTLRMIVVKFGSNWPSGFRGEDFLKSLRTTDDRQRTPSDGNSSHGFQPGELKTGALNIYLFFFYINYIKIRYKLNKLKMFSPLVLIRFLSEVLIFLNSGDQVTTKLMIFSIDPL